MVTIEDVFEFIRNGVTIKQHSEKSGFPITRIETISNRIVDRTRMGYAGITDISKYKNYIMQDGDILMSHINSIQHLGKSAIYKKLDNEQIIHGMNLLCLRPKKDKIYDSFALYYFSSDAFYRQIVNITKPSVNQASFTVSALKKLSFPSFSISEQQNIASKFDTIEQIIIFRKQQLSKLDQLVKSRFIEMFGDVKNNTSSWDIAKLHSIIKSCDAGWSGSGTQRERQDNELAVLKVSAITKGYFDPYEYKVLDNQKNIKKYIYPQKGDLIFSRANTKELVGATAIINKDYPQLILPDKLWRIKFNNNTNVYYVKYALSDEFYRKKISSISTGTSGSMFNVSMEKFKSMDIPLPPLHLQEQFAAFVQQVDKIKLSIKQSLEKLETLKKSLMQEYFG